MTKIKRLSICLSILGVFSSALMLAQAQRRVYYDKEGKLLISEKGAEYFRTYFVDKDGSQSGYVKDYYITGVLKWEGAFLHLDWENMENSMFEGPCTWYYPNGQKECFANYKNGKLDWKYVEYQEDGRVLCSISYIEGVKTFIKYKVSDFVDCFSNDSNFYNKAENLVLNYNFRYEPAHQASGQSYMYIDTFDSLTHVISTIYIGSSGGSSEFTLMCDSLAYDTNYVQLKQDIRRKGIKLDDNLTNYFSSFEVYQFNKNVFALLDKKNEVTWFMNRKHFDRFKIKKLNR